MAIRRSPGCNCCGSTVEPCVCCDSTDIKPSPVKTGPSYSDTTWDDGWVGVNDKTVNTLPANTHAYYDIELKCSTNWSFEVEVIDFGTSSGAKIWCEGLEVENYCMDGTECVVTCSSGASYGIGKTSVLSFGGERYVAARLSSTLVPGGAQEYGCSIQDASEKRIDDGDVFFYTQMAHALWHAEQTGIENKTIRINIETSSSDIEIGQVSVVYGSSDCGKKFSHTEGDNTSYRYIMTDARCVNSGAADMTVTEDSDGTVIANGDIYCPDPDPRPCPSWQNVIDVNYSAMNGTYIYTLERQTNWCAEYLDGSIEPTYESVPSTVLSDWAASVQAWDFDDTRRPIRFWEYFLTEPLVDTSLSGNNYDDDWFSWTLGTVCHIGAVTVPNARVPDPTRLATPSVDPPVVSFTPDRQSTLINCRWVDLCLDHVYPAMYFAGEGVADKVRQKIVRTFELADVANSFTVSNISVSIDQTQPTPCDGYGDWTLDVTGTGFTMNRTITYTQYEHTLTDDRASSVTPSTKAGSVSNLTIDYTAGPTTVSQTGASYVPSLTFVSGFDPGGCNPDNSYEISSTPTQEATYAVTGTIKAGQWIRVDVDNGDKWDISVGRQGFDFYETVTVRKYDDCHTLSSVLSVPSDRCEPFSVNLSDSDYDVTFDLEWA
jgi:hypothetical protein